ncbi:MAG: Smr/MutS family protein [Acidobacteria bacterium]|nr:Smr/MutS family protein [Acidobacteriota bacterium]
MTEDAPIRVPIEDVLDLHAFAPADVLSVVEEYLVHARDHYSSVRLIHGKGTGYQRERVRALLSRLDFVQQFANAPEEAGGWGATIVWFTPGPGVGAGSR